MRSTWDTAADLSLSCLCPSAPQNSEDCTRAATNLHLSPTCSSGQGSALPYCGHVLLTSQDPALSPIVSHTSRILHTHPSRSRTGEICLCAPCAALSPAAHPPYSLHLHWVTPFTKVVFLFMGLSPLKTIRVCSPDKTPLSPPELLPQPHTSPAPLPPQICSLLPYICAYLLLCLCHISQIQAERS